MMKMQNNTIQEAVLYIKNELGNLFNNSEIQQITALMLQHYFGISKKGYLLEPSKRLSESELLKVIYAVKDLKKNKPLAYIFGEWQFYDLTFKLNEHTLIPRPETEEIVQLIIKENKLESPSIIDIGTGSGCIAIAIKKNILKSKITAIDVSEKALEIANQNAQINNVDVRFSILDILKPQQLNEKYDVIVSNPPYIPLRDKETMENNVLQYEPHLALFVENDSALLFYDKIANFAILHLNEKGILYVEIHEQKGSEVKHLFETKGFRNIRIIKDISEKDRIISCQLN